MNTIFFDECFENLYYAQETMKDWIQLSDYEIIFEAVSPDVQDKIFKNEETGEKSVGFIQKAINAIIALIQKVLSPIKDFIDRFTMSGAEREAYEQFKQEIAKDPKLRNRKVSVSDFRTITSNYDKMIAEVDKEIKAVKADPNRSIDETVKKVTDFISGTVSATTAIVGVDMATKIADSNIEMAKAIQNVLNEEKSIMDTLSKQLGKKDAKKFKKDIDAAAKNTALHRLKVSLFRKKYDSLQDCISGTFDAFKQISPKNFGLYNKLLKNEYTGKVIKTAGKTLVKGEVELAKQKHEEKRNAKEQKKAQKSDEKEAVKEAKRDAKHAKDPKYKPKEDFILGRK